MTSPIVSRTRRPHECRPEIGDLKSPERHFENPGDQRHRGPQRSEEPADENSENAPFLHEGFAARNKVGMARQRPHVRDRVFELEADPVGQPVADGGTKRRRNPDRPEADAARADQGADCHQRAPGRNQQRDESERFPKRQRKNDRRRPTFVVADEVDDVLGDGLKVHRRDRARPRCLSCLTRRASAAPVRYAGSSGSSSGKR